jgi:hypothetical protein
MAITFEELAGSPTFHITRIGGTAKRMGLIAWGEIPSFLSEVLPAIVIAGDEQRVPPGSPFPQFPWLFADSLDIEPQEGLAPSSSLPPNYTKAKVTINYRTRTHDEQKDKNDDDRSNPSTMFTHSISVGGEFVILPMLGLKWNSDDAPVTEEVGAGQRIVTTEHTLTWNYCPIPPWSSIRTMAGKVNDAVFMGAPKEALLFLGATAEREVSSDGARQWKLSYKFSERRVTGNTSADGWNYFFRSSTGLPERVDRKDGSRVYSLADFTKLLRPGLPGET